MLYSSLVDSILAFKIEEFHNREDKQHIRDKFVAKLQIDKADNLIQVQKKIQNLTGINFDGLDKFVEGGVVVLYDEELDSSKFVEYGKYATDRELQTLPFSLNFSFDELLEDDVQEDEIIFDEDEIDLNVGEFVIEEDLSKGTADTVIAAISQLLCSSKDTAHVNITPFVEMLNNVSALMSSESYFDKFMEGHFPIIPGISNEVYEYKDFDDMRKFLTDWKAMYSNTNSRYIDKEQLSYHLLCPFVTRGNSYKHSATVVVASEDCTVWSQQTQKFMRAIGRDGHYYSGDTLFVESFVTRSTTDDAFEQFNLVDYLKDLAALAKGDEVTVVVNNDPFRLDPIKGVVSSVTKDHVSVSVAGKDMVVKLEEYGGVFVFKDEYKAVSKYTMLWERSYLITPTPSIKQSLSYILPSNEELFVFAVKEKRTMRNTREVVDVVESEYGIRVTDNISQAFRNYISKEAASEPRKVEFRTSDAKPTPVPKTWRDYMKDAYDNLGSSDIFQEVVEASEEDGDAPARIVYASDLNLYESLKEPGITVVICPNATSYVWKDGSHAKQLKFYKGKVYDIGKEIKAFTVKDADKAPIVEDVKELLDESTEPFGEVSLTKPMYVSLEYRKEKKYTGDVREEEFVNDVLHVEVLESDNGGSYPDFDADIDIFCVGVFGLNHPDIMKIKEATRTIVKYFVDKHFKSKGIHSNNFEKPKDFWLSNEAYNALMVIHDNNEAMVMKDLSHVVAYYMAAVLIILIKLKEFQIIGISAENKQFEVVQRTFEMLYGTRDRNEDMKFINATAQKILMYEKMLRGILSNQAKNIVQIDEKKYDVWPTYRPQLMSNRLENVGQLTMSRLQHRFAQQRLMRTAFDKVPLRFNMVIIEQHDSEVEKPETKPPQARVLQEKMYILPRREEETSEAEVVSQESVVSIEDREQVVATDDELLQEFLKENNMDSALKTFEEVIEKGITPLSGILPKAITTLSAEKLKQPLLAFIYHDLGNICKFAIRKKHLLESLSTKNTETLATYIVAFALNKYKQHTEEIHAQLEKRVAMEEIDVEQLQNKFDVMRNDYNQAMWGPLKNIPKDDRELYTILLESKLITTKDLADREDELEEETEMIPIHNVDDDD